MRARSVRGLKGFARWSSAPRSSAVTTSSSEERTVSIITGTRDSSRIRRRTSYPVSRGMDTSSTTRSGRSRAKAARAEGPSGASTVR
jgi:hypothetical protein